MSYDDDDAFPPIPPIILNDPPCNPDVLRTGVMQSLTTVPIQEPEWKSEMGYPVPLGSWQTTFPLGIGTITTSHKKSRGGAQSGGRGDYDDDNGGDGNEGADDYDNDAIMNDVDDDDNNGQESANGSDDADVISQDDEDDTDSSLSAADVQNNEEENGDEENSDDEQDAKDAAHDNTLNKYQQNSNPEVVCVAQNNPTDERKPPVQIERVSFVAKSVVDGCEIKISIIPSRSPFSDDFIIDHENTTPPSRVGTRQSDCEYKIINTTTKETKETTTTKLDYLMIDARTHNRTFIANIWSVAERRIKYHIHWILDSRPPSNPIMRPAPPVHNQFTKTAVIQSLQSLIDKGKSLPKDDVERIAMFETPTIAPITNSEDLAELWLLTPGAGIPVALQFGQKIYLNASRFLAGPHVAPGAIDRFGNFNAVEVFRSDRIEFLRKKASLHRERLTSHIAISQIPSLGGNR